MVIVVMGPAGAGKTTVGRALATALGWTFADADDFHPPANVARMRAGQPLGDAERAPWLAALAAHVARCVAGGQGAVLACSALRQRYRAALVPPGTAHAVRFVYLHVDAAVLAERLAVRAGHFFAPALLASQLATLEPPGADEPAPVLTLDGDQSPAAIVAAIRRALPTGAPIVGASTAGAPAHAITTTTRTRAMRIGMVGLGRMGANMSTRLLRGGHEVVVHDRNPEAMRAVVEAGATSAPTLEGLVALLGAPTGADAAGSADVPRAVWVMVPAGEATETTVLALGALLSAGDVVVDGGNSNYQDTMRRAAQLAARGVHLVDSGTSGGVWGLAEGYSLMVGGDAGAVEHLRPILATLAPAPDLGWGRVGPSGAGHFVKMIHNGIEYGMMQAFAEGFSILSHKTEFGLDLAQVAEIWRHGSVVRSWLLDLAARALADDATLADIAPVVGDSGEGRWTVAEAIALDVPAPVITHALIARLRSRDTGSYADRMLAALRQQFGGHAVTRAGRAETDA
jgi:6-phosphogluconate dehydrogenase